MITYACDNQYCTKSYIPVKRKIQAMRHITALTAITIGNAILGLAQWEDIKQLHVCIVTLGLLQLSRIKLPQTIVKAHIDNNIL